MYTSAILLMTSSIIHAEERDATLLNLGSEPHYLQRTDMNMSNHEYEEIYRHNQKLVLKNVRSYSKNALEMIGMPEQGVKLVGASLGLLFNDTSLNLNRSKTLALELKDVRDSDSSLYLKYKLKW
jgi:hypothetical protein